MERSPEERAELIARYDIRTEFVYPPIPIRLFDWAAWSDRKGADWRTEYAASAEAAINDLLEYIEDLPEKDQLR